MPAALLDINDSNLQLWHEGAHLQSPGYALLEGKQYRFGQAAREAARLRPREINTRYWWQLSTESLQPAMGPARHTADLVHAHLEALHGEGGRPAELILAVSGSMQREQLSLLLGITQQCPFDAVGLVNRSTVLGSLYGGQDRLFHLEIQLHQAVVTEVSTGAAQAEAGRSTPLPGCGMLELQERLVAVVATAFIRQTRFDPRRKATTEQALYDALPRALADLAAGTEAAIEINGYRARVDYEDMCVAGQHLFDNLPSALESATDNAAIIADPLAGLLPGLAQRLPDLQVLPTDALPRALEQHRDRLVQRKEALDFITTLPRLAQENLPATPTEEAPVAPVAQATHVLQGTRARPLEAAGTSLDQHWQLAQVDHNWQLLGDGSPPRVNGSDHQPGQPLVPGDNIQLGSGDEFLLIEVADQA